jgi:hypothetical protein
MLSKDSLKCRLIPSKLNMTDIIPKFRTEATFVNTDLQTLLYKQYIEFYMIYLRTNVQSPGFNGSLIIAIRPTAKRKCSQCRHVSETGNCSCPVFYFSIFAALTTRHYYFPGRCSSQSSVCYHILYALLQLLY